MAEYWVVLLDASLAEQWAVWRVENLVGAMVALWVAHLADE